jgi:alpha-ketoglutarate-dependent taurine dioxygenase
MMLNSVLPPHNVHQFSWGRSRTPRHPETTSLAFHSRSGHPMRRASACKVRTSWWDAIYNPTYPAGEILAAVRCTTTTATLCWLVCTKRCPYTKGAARTVVVSSLQSQPNETTNQFQKTAPRHHFSNTRSFHLTIYLPFSVPGLAAT